MLDFSDDNSVFFGGDFDEPAVYVPAGGKPKRSIRVIVRRFPPSYVTQDSEGPRLVSPKMVIQVPNSTVNGISSAELNAGGNDRIEIAWQIGGAVTSFGIYRPEGAPGAMNDAGVLTLELK